MPRRTWSGGGLGTVSSLLQKALTLGQAVHDVLKDSSLKGRQRAQALHRPGLKKADAGVDDPPLPEVKDVVQGHDVGHKSGQETGFVAFVVELLT